MNVCTIAGVVCRIIPDYENNGDDLVIAPYEKMEFLIAEGWDEHICYYATEAEMQLSDKKLFQTIYS
jgi:hypothetical protein